jgi:hypothetical protein
MKGSSANFSSCGSMLGCGRPTGSTTEAKCREFSPTEGSAVIRRITAYDSASLNVRFRTEPS